MRLIVPLLLAAGAIAPDVAHARPAQPVSAKATHAPRTASRPVAASHASSLVGVGSLVGTVGVGGSWAGWAAYVATRPMSSYAATPRPVSPE